MNNMSQFSLRQHILDSVEDRKKARCNLFFFALFLTILLLFYRNNREMTRNCGGYFNQELLQVRFELAYLSHQCYACIKSDVSLCVFFCVCWNDISKYINLSQGNNCAKGNLNHSGEYWHLLQ